MFRNTLKKPERDVKYYELFVSCTMSTFVGAKLFSLFTSRGNEETDYTLHLLSAYLIFQDGRENLYF